jgi:hypothetical protein
MGRSMVLSRLARRAILSSREELPGNMQQSTVATSGRASGSHLADMSASEQFYQRRFRLTHRTKLGDNVFQRQSNIARFDQAFSFSRIKRDIDQRPPAPVQINSGNQRTDLPFFSRLGAHGPRTRLTMNAGLTGRREGRF